VGNLDGHRTIPEQTAGANPEADIPDFGPAADPLLADLTEAQQEAVLHDEGPLLVLAAAGSGKTRVITRRIARLIRDGAAPWRVLALTFTNKAAGEMRERVTELLGEGASTRGLTIATFHSLCARLLRRYAEVANLPGLSPNFTIYDTADQRALMKQVIADVGLSTSHFAPRSVLAAISNAKNDLKTAKTYAGEAHDFYTKTVARLFEAYEQAKRRAEAVDFDDLLLLTVRMLTECPEAREEVRDRWRHLLIDEYQDTNKAQFVLSTMLVGAENEELGPNVCVVGDPDQSIYGWRGADITNILEFETQYPKARTIALGQNFRSTAPILAVADTLIRLNQQRKHKDLYTAREGGEQVAVTICRDERHEAELIVDWMRTLRDEQGLSWKDMAVFYRTNALSRVMEDAFRNAGVPYVIARGTAFYDREEIRDALAYLRVAANPADEVSLRRIVNKPARGLGKTTLGRIDVFGRERDVPLLEALRLAAAGEAPGVAGRAQEACRKFVALLESWTGSGVFMGAETMGSLADLVERIIRESGLEKHYGAKEAKRESAPDEDRVENLAEMVSSAREFESQYDPQDDPAVRSGETPPLLAMLRAYLESVALVADADSVDPAQGAVTLMTLHAAKGLEFPAVAIIGLEDGLLPHSRSRESEAELEEERRLCFVGITRAKERLLITSARRRTVRGVSERTIQSPFIGEMQCEHVVVSDQAGDDLDWPDARAGGGSWSLEDRFSGRRRGGGAAETSSGERVQVGSVVRHPKFGTGRVEALMTAERDARARIRFQGAGSKTLVLKHAPLAVIE